MKAINNKTIINHEKAINTNLPLSTFNNEMYQGRTSNREKYDG